MEERRFDTMDEIESNSKLKLCIMLSYLQKYSL